MTWPSPSHHSRFVDLPQSGAIGVGMIHIRGQDLKNGALKALDEHDIGVTTLIPHHVAHSGRDHNDHNDHSRNQSRRHHHGFR